MPERKAGFLIECLPKTAQDAVWWTRQLGSKYLWLDSLCILQDDLGDGEVELSTMADIYQKSTITIAAIRSENANQGCRPNANVLSRTPCRLQNGIMILPDYGRDTWIFQNSTLDTRAWCLQETQLSNRVLRVGGEEIAWQCRRCKRLEGDPGNERVHDIQDNITFFGSRALDTKASAKAWFILCQSFGRRNISFSADKLPAFSGMAAHFKHILQSDYVAGLWTKNLLRGLLWRMSRPGHRIHYRAPSWSWASIEGGFLGWHVWLYEASDETFPASVIDVWTKVPGLNPYGRVTAGKLTMCGKIAPLPSSLFDDESQTESVDWRRYLLYWDRDEVAGTGSVLFRLHDRACLMLQPAGRPCLWTRIGTLSTAMDGIDPPGRVKATVGLLDSYEWRDAVVSVV